MSTREATMQALARLAVGDPQGELGRGAALALARVVLEESPEPGSLSGAGLAKRLLEAVEP